MNYVEATEDLAPDSYFGTLVGVRTTCHCTRQFAYPWDLTNFTTFKTAYNYTYF
ncbi:MAG: hypothetical protein QY328_09615 [Anaerolineales bacterium]|nr:MAG: hypothetical protein QY328_09615 [Anaerolineales bacterium]